MSALQNVDEYYKAGITALQSLERVLLCGAKHFSLDIQRTLNAMREEFG